MFGARPQSHPTRACLSQISLFLKLTLQKIRFFIDFILHELMNLFFLLFFISEDVFAIDEVTMFEGEDWNEKKYAVAGDILDGHLYDLFMTMLEVRESRK